MKKEKAIKLDFKWKTIIAILFFLIGVAGLVLSSFYFSKDYSHFLNVAKTDASNFWLGFLVLASIIISSCIVLSSSIICFVILIRFINSRKEID